MCQSGAEWFIHLAHCQQPACASALQERAEGLAEQQRQQQQREEVLLQESAALQASLLVGSLVQMLSCIV
jgi:hypothetical protein